MKVKDKYDGLVEDIYQLIQYIKESDIHEKEKLLAQALEEASKLEAMRDKV